MTRLKDYSNLWQRSKKIKELARLQILRQGNLLADGSILRLIYGVTMACN